MPAWGSDLRKALCTEIGRQTPQNPALSIEMETSRAGRNQQSSSQQLLFWLQWVSPLRRSQGNPSRPGRRFSNT